MELSLRTSLDAQVESDGSVVVPGRLLVDIARLLPDADVQIEHRLEEGVLAVTCGSASYRLHTYSANPVEPAGCVNSIRLALAAHVGLAADYIARATPTSWRHIHKGNEPASARAVRLSADRLGRPIDPTLSLVWGGKISVRLPENSPDLQAGRQLWCPTGYADALSFPEKHACGVRAWAVEGAGHYGAGLTRYLTGQGEAVLEVGRHARVERRLRGKDDPLDAIRAARAGVAAETLTLPRAGRRQEALRVPQRRRRSSRRARPAAQRDRHGARAAPFQITVRNLVPKQVASTQVSVDAHLAP